MFQSLSKRMKESLDEASTKADSLLAQARTQIAANRQQSASTNQVEEQPATTITKPSNVVVCSDCSRNLTVYENLWLKSNHKCRVCAKIFCSKCIGKSPIPVPHELLNSEYKQSKGSDLKVDEKHVICLHSCLPNVTSYAFDKFCKDMNEKTYPNLLAYLRNDSMHHEFFALPSAAAEDTSYRRTLRVAQVAEKIVDFTSFSMALKAAKFAFYGSELLQIVLEGDMYSVLSPLLGSLKAYGIDGPTALLRLYYLGCKHTLEVKQCITPRRLLYDDLEHGVLAQQCPVEILNYINRYISGAEWLYSSQLPPPHDSNNDWSAWYLSRMITKQKWTVIMCINESTKLPNGMKCPAFALLARKRELKSDSQHAEGTPKYHKEAMLVVRGSKSTLDWSINFDEGMVAFDYNYFPADSEIMHTCTGFVHKGIHYGAKGILDGYNVRQYLMKLLQQQFSIKIVGHSLGAGVASMIAAEMRNTAILHHMQILSNPSLSMPNSNSKSASAEPSTGESISRQVHRISAIVFSAPAIINDTLANVFLLDRLLVNIVNGYDTIPRLNRNTFQQLAKEIQDFVPQANEWTEQDKLDLSDYVTSFGKASDVFSSTKQMRKQRMQRLKKSASSSNNNTGGSVMIAGEDEGKTTGGEDLLVVAQRNAAAASKSIESVVSYFNTTVTATVSTVSTPSTIESTNHTTLPPHPEHTSSVLTETNELQPEEIAEATAPLFDDDQQLIRNDLVSVTPGPIVHLYKENDGYIRASLVTHQHSTFQKITLLPNYLLSEHKISSYRKMLQSAIFSATKSSAPPQQQQQQHRPTTISREQEEYYNRYFPKCLMDELFYDEYETAALVSIGPDSTVSEPVPTAKTTEGEDSFSLYGYFKPIFSKKSKDAAAAAATSPVDATVEEMLRKDNYLAEKEEPDNDRSNSVSGEDDDEWMPCGICGLEVTWPYRMHSDAARALVTHHCCNCGIVICTLCGPAGEKLPGDGINTSYELPDFRLALPHRGLIGLQRVCVNCYFDSNHPGL